MPLDDIVTCRIHPAIGIARVGNSESEFFIGPEIPGGATPPPGGYKQSGSPGLLKRQAARFRVFGYDANDNIVQELSAAEADIVWTVSLKNKKAEWFPFDGPAGEHESRQGPRRNNGINDRASLIIDAGQASISGTNQPRKKMSGVLNAAAPAIPVMLGEIGTDDQGRLVVLGGLGRTESWLPRNPITHYANNDGWFDDVADGPVTATVQLKASGRQVKDVRPAWVIVAPPDFAPEIANIVTLYDVIYEAALKRGFIKPLIRPSYDLQILPILTRAVMLQWTNPDSLKGHGPNRIGDFLNNPRWAKLGIPDPAFSDRRGELFSVVRNPAATGQDAIDQASPSFMPRLAGDDSRTGELLTGAFSTWLTVTRTQYGWLSQWKDGDFDKSGPTQPAGITPDGLDRAALEACAGGAFYPGIEAGWIMRRESIYREAFRIDHNYADEFEPGHPTIEAGDITKRMACPWKADFFECRVHWWPAQRPDNVLSQSTFAQVRQLDEQLANLAPGSPQFQQLLATRNQVYLAGRELWARPLPQSEPEGDNALVDVWSRLGIVASAATDGTPFLLNGKAQFVEVDRDPSL